MNESVRRYFHAGALAVWGAVAMGFYFSGRIASYLHPSFHGWTLFSGIILLLLAAGIIFFPLGQTCCEDDCGGAHTPKSWLGLILTTSLLTIPLLAAVQISPSQFGSVAVMNRGLAESIIDLPGYEPYTEPPLPNQDGSIGAAGDAVDTGSYLIKNSAGQIETSPIDLLYAAHEPDMLADFENKEVEVIGQFFPAKKNNPHGDRFSLIRMFIMCCAADARPVAVTVKTKTPESFADMSWVRVTGRATFPYEGGNRVAVIVADSITPCEAPNESFIY